MLLPLNLQNALRYYSGEADAYTGMPSDAKAYNTLNALFFPGTTTEETRVREGKPLNPAILDDSTPLLPFCMDLLEALQYSSRWTKAGTVYRVDRYDDVEQMVRTGKTTSFTSTSTAGFLKDYRNKERLVLLEFTLKEGIPCADLSVVLSAYSKPEEAEILLPPNLPVKLDKVKMTESDNEIRDKDGNQPCDKYKVSVCMPAPDAAVCGKRCDVDDISGRAAGRRVYEALNNGQAPNENDRRLYCQWKESFQTQIEQCQAAPSLKTWFDRQLFKLNDMTGCRLSSDMLFDKKALQEWMTGFLGVEKDSSIGRLITSDYITPERLTHAVTTFLLGSVVRDNLHLCLDFLPRILSLHSAGSSFNFFWSVTCLFHDLGYFYEDNSKSYDLSQFTKSTYRQEHLHLSSSRPDLLSLTDEDAGELKKRFPQLTEQELSWATKSLQLTAAYDQYRREIWKTIDHGIAGALMLYDYLMEVAEQEAGKKAVAAHPGRHQTHAPVGDDGNPAAGSLAANEAHSRFSVCALLISLSVARHNMWTANEKTVGLYDDYHLNALIGTKTAFTDSLNQLLYFLCFMDTIDPVKTFYTRPAESGALTADAVEQRKYSLMSGLRIRFDRSHDGQPHYISMWFDDSLQNIPEKESRTLLSKYCDDVNGMSSWLEIPKIADSKLGDCMCFSAFPCGTSVGKTYGFGVTEDEVKALCLYEGSGDTADARLFYLLPNAYQTFNLLMMEGIEGERVRIGSEHQRPNGIYIRYWEETLRVFENVFIAQCKNTSAHLPAGTVLYRVDREVNFEQMRQKNSTIAFTSTSKARFLKEIAAPKRNVILLEIKLTQPIPMADYAAILGGSYAFTYEEECLIPPFVIIESTDEIVPTDEERKVDVQESARKYVITLGGMEFNHKHEIESVLRTRLHELSESAAHQLTGLATNTDKAKAVQETDAPAYFEWKKVFRQLAMLRLHRIYETFF